MDERKHVTQGRNGTCKNQKIQIGGPMDGHKEGWTIWKRMLMDEPREVGRYD